MPKPRYDCGERVQIRRYPVSGHLRGLPYERGTVSSSDSEVAVRLDCGITVFCLPGDLKCESKKPTVLKLYQT